MAPVPVPLLVAGCDGSLSTLAPAGPVAAEVVWLWWTMLAGAAAITLLVTVLVVMGFGPPRDTSARHWTHTWGLGFSLAVLSALLAAGLWVGERILPRDDGAVEVRAHAFMWGWSFTQPGEGGAMVETAGTLYIPAGQPINVIVTTEDVIHSFWVPQLAGKLDAIPGRDNVMRLQADSPGTYGGLCAEFCGIGHAGMRFELVAYAEGEFPDALQLNDPADDPAVDPAEEAADD